MWTPNQIINEDTLAASLSGYCQKPHNDTILMSFMLHDAKSFKGLVPPLTPS